MTKLGHLAFNCVELFAIQTGHYRRPM